MRYRVELKDTDEKNENERGDQFKMYLSHFNEHPMHRPEIFEGKYIQSFGQYCFHPDLTISNARIVRQHPDVRYQKRRLFQRTFGLVSCTDYGSV